MNKIRLKTMLIFCATLLSSLPVCSAIVLKNQQVMSQASEWSIGSGFGITGLFFDVRHMYNLLIIKTTVRNKNYTQAGIQLTTPRYRLTRAGAELGSQCIPQPNGLCQFRSTVSQSLAHNISITGPEGPFNFILCLNATGHITCQNQVGYQIDEPAMPLRAYITNQLGGSLNGTVSVCDIDVNGDMTNCGTAGQDGLFNNIQQIALNADDSFAYIANSDSNSVLKCAINPSNGTFTACSDSGVGASFSTPTGIALNREGSFAYVTNNGSLTVFQCAILPNGDFASCQSLAGFSSAGSARGIVVDKADNFAYIADPINFLVHKCSMQSDGTFESCASANPGIDFPDAPYGIALNGDETVVYVTHNLSHEVSHCPIHSNGDFDACSTIALLTPPTGITLNAAGSFAYVVAGQENHIKRCVVNPDQTLGTCSNTSAAGLNNPSWIALAY